MEATPLVIASHRFEAARRINNLPAGHRCGGLHGHGFVASVHASPPLGWSAFDGSACVGLQDRLARCVGPLDYSLLNDYLGSPDDRGLAAWIEQRIDVPRVERVAIQSTPSQGVYIVPGEQSVHAWRRYTFHAAHRLPYVPVGHKCGRLHGHGFAVIVHTNTRDNRGYDELDRLWAPLQSALNYQCLNDIQGLENPTSEMLSAWMWERLKPLAPSLTAITVFETASCGATYDGAQYRIWKDFTLDSAVRMASAPPSDPRHRVHGHTYTLRLILSAPLDAVMGWTVDFGDVKAIFDPLFKALDHHPLHEQPGLESGDPETIAAWVMRRTKQDLPQLSSVELYETEGRGVIVGDHRGDPGLPI